MNYCLHLTIESFKLMKHFSFILLLLLLVSAGNIRAEELSGLNGNNSLKFLSTNFVSFQTTGICEGVADDQDTNEMDGFEACFIHPAPATGPLQTSINIKTAVHSVIVPVRINSFLIDLPPPSLS